MRSYLSSMAFLQKRENRTYTLELVLEESNVGPLTWRCIPCPPEAVEKMVVDISLDGKEGEVRFWGCGGPTGTVRSLYQSLNWFVHCGPLLDHEKMLARPLRLRSLELLLAVESRVCCGELAALLERMADSRMLCGVVGHYAVCKGLERIEADVKERLGTTPTVPREWDRYGFEWGEISGLKETIGSARMRPLESGSG
ncbi:hypothetical protein EJ03DRAFT_59259 [Teratosphaeria nubilosa]|uniref:Uncharacterized protein n=1 Tax=Teratosphaeria nubilosa TaxID=161662 RepID=A0A6G1LCB6_9PEZI|nr:hypothetical protein EJ03DRAFT_59259 [Teratosphaeria nubilosa]